jgi:hypothetical protein
MSDLTGELQRMAVGAADRARPLAADEIIRQGDRMLRRSITRIIVGGLSVAGIIAAVVLAVTALLHPGHATPHRGIQLAAWTVVKKADGTVLVTIRELRDPAGLQRKLRADDIPATVTFLGQLPRSCRPYNAGVGLINRVFTERHMGRPTVLAIHPSALPRGTGVEIGAPVHAPLLQRRIIWIAIGLERASRQCTGS